MGELFLLTFLFIGLVREVGCIQQVGATLPKLSGGGVYGTREEGGGIGGAAG
jgi:hypothetical protein